MKNFEGVNITSACNNIRPLEYNTWAQLKNNYDGTKNMTTTEYVIYWIKAFLDGSLQFVNKNNVLSFTINKVLSENNISDIQETWDDIYTYPSWSWDTKTLTDINDQINYKNKKEKIQKIYKQIALSIINKTYNSLFNTLKKESYILKNKNDCYISSLSSYSYRYLSSQNKAKKISGLQKETLKNHFAIIRDGFSFVKVS